MRGEERGGGKRGGHAEGAGETRVEERWEVKERREEKVFNRAARTSVCTMHSRKSPS